MSQGALISWKEESGTIHREMDRLLRAGWVETAEECRVRKIQFMTLIERRNVAAYNYLKSDGDTARVPINPQNPSDTPRGLPNLDPMFEVETQEPSGLFPLRACDSTARVLRPRRRVHTRAAPPSAACSPNAPDTRRHFVGRVLSLSREFNRLG